MNRRASKAKILMSRNDFLSRLPFMVAVAVGGGILCLMKYSAIHQLYVSFVAILFIVLYALSVILVPSLRLREDQLGDNCYYLGFLYTLGSLVWALYAFSKSNNIDEIIANFGLALFSTIAGIMLRVVINQSRKDILETERECRIELSSAVSRMRSNIDEATYSLESFCRLTQQLVQENINNTVKKSAKTMESCSQSLATVNEKVIASINNGINNHEQYTVKLGQAVAAIEKEIVNIAEKLKNVQIDKSIIQSRLDPVVANIETSLNEITDKMNNSVKIIERELLAVADRINYVEVDKEIIHKKLEPLSAHIEDSILTLTHTIKEHNNSLMQEMKRSKSITVELANTLSELAELMIEKIR